MRHPKPCFCRLTCNPAGPDRQKKLHNLGPDKEEAIRKYHEWMTGRQAADTTALCDHDRPVPGLEPAIRTSSVAPIRLAYACIVFRSHRGIGTKLDVSQRPAGLRHLSPHRSAVYQRLRAFSERRDSYLSLQRILGHLVSHGYFCTRKKAGHSMKQLLSKSWAGRGNVGTRSTQSAHPRAPRHDESACPNGTGGDGTPETGRGGKWQ